MKDVNRISLFFVDFDRLGAVQGGLESGSVWQCLEALEALEEGNGRHQLNCRKSPGRVKNYPQTLEEVQFLRNFSTKSRQNRTVEMKIGSRI